MTTTNLSRTARTAFANATRQYDGAYMDFMASRTEANQEALRKANQELDSVKAKYRID